jgi:Herpesviridae UL52/UL70 DNA primase
MTRILKFCVYFYSSLSFADYVLPFECEVDAYILIIITGSWSIYCRPGPCYRIRYTVTRNRWCDNVQRAHKSNGIAIEVDLTFLVLTQVCFDHDCKGYRSEPLALPLHCRSVQVDRSLTASSPQGIISIQHDSSNMLSGLNSMEGPSSLGVKGALLRGENQFLPQGRCSDATSTQTMTLSDSGYALIQENTSPMTACTVAGNHANVDSAFLSLHDFCESVLMQRQTSQN